MIDSWHGRVGLSAFTCQLDTPPHTSQSQEYFTHLSTDKIASLGELDQAFDVLLKRPLSKLEDPAAPPETLSILIDAVDEADGLSTGCVTANPVLTLLGEKMHTLPSWVRFIVTSRCVRVQVSISSNIMPCEYKI